MIESIGERKREKKKERKMSWWMIVVECEIWEEWFFRRQREGGKE